MATIKGWHAALIAEKVKKIFDKKGYAFFDGKSSWNVNIVGIRNSCSKANRFDDMMLAIYRNGRKKWEVRSYQITTDPGKYWLKRPMNIDGTAIVVPNQYRSIYKIGKHRGLYEALVQTGGRISVYRDSDKDEILDMEPDSVSSGYYGINIHKAGRDSSAVEKWSAGCQVFKRAQDYAVFMGLCDRASNLYGNSFTYTLLEEQDFNV